MVFSQCPCPAACNKRGARTAPPRRRLVEHSGGEQAAHARAVTVAVPLEDAEHPNRHEIVDLVHVFEMSSQHQQIPVRGTDRDGDNRLTAVRGQPHLETLGLARRLPVRHRKHGLPPHDITHDTTLGDMPRRSTAHIPLHNER